MNEQPEGSAMPTLQITFTIPAGTTVNIAGLEGAMVASPLVAQEEAIKDYWRHYLSDNSRKVFGAAARIEEVRGPGFTFDDIASTVSQTYESVRSLHRTSGRTAKKWRAEKGIDEPVRLDEVEYAEGTTGEGWRTRYQLPPGVAAIVVDLPLVGGRGAEA
jgi:hypothetical protein